MSQISSKPLIGISLDFQESGTFSKRPHYALRHHYFQAVTAAGGVPVGLSYDDEIRADLVARCDGIIVPGGGFASPPEWYVDGDKTPYEPSRRLQADMDLIRAALDADKPLLGICAGMQILAGVLGCKMIGDIQKHYPNAIDHLNAQPAEHHAHKVILEKDCKLNALLGVSEFPVNTAHREAVVQGATGINITGHADDGVVEAVEVTGQKFAIGVQWHPEFFLDPADPSFQLMQKFIDAAR